MMAQSRFAFARRPAHQLAKEAFHSLPNASYDPHPLHQLYSYAPSTPGHPLSFDDKWLDAPRVLRSHEWMSCESARLAPPPPAPEPFVQEVVETPLMQTRAWVTEQNDLAVTDARATLGLDQPDVPIRLGSIPSGKVGPEEFFRTLDELREFPSLALNIKSAVIKIDYVSSTHEGLALIGGMMEYLDAIAPHVVNLELDVVLDVLAFEGTRHALERCTHLRRLKISTPHSTTSKSFLSLMSAFPDLGTLVFPLLTIIPCDKTDPSATLRPTFFVDARKIMGRERVFILRKLERMLQRERASVNGCYFMIQLMPSEEGPVREHRILKSRY